MLDRQQTSFEKKEEEIIMTSIATFIRDLKEEKAGYSFGDPWRYDDEFIWCVVPILRKSDEVPGYITLSKARKVRIVDTGMIHKVRIINEDEKPVFIRMGEVLKGDTQERAVVKSRVIMPGTKAEIDVVCVHASKPINADADFKSGGFAPMKEALFADAMVNNLRVDQSKSWERDRIFHARARRVCAEFLTEERAHGFNVIRSDDLCTAKDEIDNLFRDVLRKMPCAANQAGMALIDSRGLLSLDCFDLHEPWKEVRDAIVTKEAVNMSQKDETGVFDYNPEKVKEKVRKVLGAEYTESVSHESPETSTIALGWKRHIGEVVILGDRVIHLLITRKDMLGSKRSN